MKWFTRQTVQGLMIAIGLIVAVTVSVTATARAQNYPTRDITCIVPYNPGGSTDPLVRQFATQLEKVLPGNINVENRPGGSGTIGAGVIVRAKPDGYTIGLGSNSILAYQPLVNTGLAYKTPDDYQPIVKLVDMPLVLVVRADAPWKTFEEFMADAKKSPGKIRASNAGLGTVNDMVLRQLNKVAGVKIVSVPLSGGGGEALVALLGGRVEAGINNGPTVAGHVQAGKVRVLAVFKKGKFEFFPDATPTFDAGYDATLSVVYCMIAPKGLPKNVQDKLFAASLRVVGGEEFRKFAKANGCVADAKGPEALKEELVQQIKVFSDLIKFISQT
jgi:tripartite-type tricarboxylate transporter receptor subunit TctC